MKCHLHSTGSRRSYFLRNKKALFKSESSMIHHNRFAARWSSKIIVGSYWCGYGEAIVRGTGYDATVRWFCGSWSWWRMSAADDMPRPDLCCDRQSCRPEVDSISKAFEVSYRGRFLGYVTTYKYYNFSGLDVVRLTWLWWTVSKR